MKVSLSSPRQNCGLIRYSSLYDKDSFALSHLLIMSVFFILLFILVPEFVCVGMEEVDKADDQTLMDSDDISLSVLI